MAATAKSKRPRASRVQRPRANSIDLATTRPGTPGGIFMRQFWHAIYRGEDLPAGQAKPIKAASPALVIAGLVVLACCRGLSMKRLIVRWPPS